MDRLLGGPSLPVRTDVKELPLKVFKQLLESEALQLQLENDIYVLLLSWLYQSPHVTDDAQRLAFFNELAPLLRYHHMTANFLANVVCECALMKESGLGLAMLRSALVQRGASAAGLESREVKQGCARRRGVVPSEASWEVKASVTLEEVAALQPNGIWKWCGLAAGYPADFCVKRETSNGNETLGIYLHLRMPEHENAPIDGPEAGVMLAYDMMLSPAVTKTLAAALFDTSGWSFLEVFGKPWAEAVREDSPHFPNGVLEVKATVKLAVKEQKEDGLKRDLEGGVEGLDYKGSKKKDKEIDQRVLSFAPLCSLLCFSMPGRSSGAIHTPTVCPLSNLA